MSRLDHLTDENRRLLAFAREQWVARFEPERSRRAFLPPCPIRVLLVADGDVDFSMKPFGLRTFVETLLNTPESQAQFGITVAHLDADATDDEVMAGDPRLSNSIRHFKFDNPGHFDPGAYDQVWLFGFVSRYPNNSRGDDSQGQPYPLDRLGQAELQVLGRFMNGGGGVFATGDHGALGACLNGAVPRVRSMRIWNGLFNPEVNMNGPRRNDTNRLGHDTESQFADQSDDVPQTIQPKMYYQWGEAGRVAYPHPLLCGRNGVIGVLPDHPHEGECIEPPNPDQTFALDGGEVAEFPPGRNNSARPLPEIIATSSVIAGMTFGDKAATESHTFGAICAYDGHRADVGRVVTDATWHHFVNINLIGDQTLPETDPKRFGFLSTPEGQAHLEQIKTYHRNVALWLARPQSIRCTNERIYWQLLWHHRVVEAVMTRSDVTVGEADVRLLFDIGRHARDVLGKIAGQCLSWRLALDLAIPLLTEDLRLLLDPWAPGAPPEPDLPWFDPEPLLDAALGGALLAMRERLPAPAPEARLAARAEAEEVLGGVAERGAAVAMQASQRSLRESTDRFVGTLLGGLQL